MASKRTHIRHLFGGGYASDFGPSADITPNQGGDIVWPFLIEAENVFYELDGGPHKIGGTSKLNSSVIESGEQIRGLFDFWRQGTTNSPTQKRIVHAGTKILSDAANGTFSVIKSGLTDDAVPCYTVFNDSVIISSDASADAAQTYDGTTIANVGGTPPTFAFSCVHKNYLWVAGDPALPSRLSYSKLLDASLWEGDGASTAGHIDIDPNDGDRITAIASHKNDLWVFKGPYKGSIHRITGSANSGSDSFNRITFINGIGAVGHNTLFRMRDDLGFMWSDGTIHSLAATAAYGDFNESALSRPIHRYLKEHLNHQYLKRAWAATNVARNIVCFTVPIDTSTYCNQVLMMDYSRQQVWWAKWPALNANCIARVIDANQASQPILMIGGTDGYVRKTDVATRSIDGATSIAARIDSPYNNYGSAITTKTLAQGSVGIAPKGNFDITVGWTRDDNAQQTDTITQGGGDVLGTASANQFTLDTSALGGALYVDRFLSFEEGGEFRSISYQLRNSGLNEDMEIHSLSVGLEVGAHSQQTTLS